MKKPNKTLRKKGVRNTSVPKIAIARPRLGIGKVKKIQQPKIRY